jgi:D-alanyl-D-alanine dipeptidase
MLIVRIRLQKKMWEKVKDNRYAADPSKGSGHNRGAAVDLTLIA